MSTDQTKKPGVGLDIGTMNIVAARAVAETGMTNVIRIRDAFIDLDLEAKKTLRMVKVDHTEMDNRLIVLGDSALNLVNLFKRELRRPLSRGVIAAGEHDAQRILSLLIKHVLGEAPVEPNEHCYYSVPAAPIDDPEQDVVYHTEVFRKIISEYGYTPHAANEAMAIIYSACSMENFSGLAVSFGSGMCNVALAYQTVSGLEFSVARGGDWIDNHAAKAMGSTAARMCAIKEKGVNLTKPTTRDEEAIALYIRSLIKYCLENISIQFRKVQTSIDLPEPVPFVISGGTTKAGGFLDVFKEEFEAIKKKGFPIQISDVRPAKDPMTAVADGLLVLAIQEGVD
jgi:actin-like ATPase involved in cell morphogenesis